MVDWALTIASVGAVTGIVSLAWHMINSRSKVILDKVSFSTKIKNTIPKNQEIDCKLIIRNKGNRSTTIENIRLLVGNQVIEISDMLRRRHVEPNSSWSFNGFHDFRAAEIKEMLKEEKIKLGIEISHTFGKLKKVGYTDFRTPWLNLW